MPSTGRRLRALKSYIPPRCSRVSRPIRPLAPVMSTFGLACSPGADAVGCPAMCSPACVAPRLTALSDILHPPRPRDPSASSRSRRAWCHAGWSARRADLNPERKIERQIDRGHPILGKLSDWINQPGALDHIHVIEADDTLGWDRV
jgi:hypothetical protein